MYRDRLNALRARLRAPSRASDASTPEAARLKRRDQLFSEMMLVALLTGLFLAWCFTTELSLTKGYTSDFYVFYNAAQRPWHGGTIYRLSEAARYLNGETTHYAPYIYAPHYLFPLRLMHGLEPRAAELLWQGAQALLLCATLMLPAVRRLADDLVRPGESRFAASADQWQQLAFLQVLPALLYVQFVGHPAAGAAALLLAGFAFLPTRPTLAGILFALLAYKFQLVLLVPVALLVTRQWRACRAFGLALAGLFLLGAWQLGGFAAWAEYGRLMTRHAEMMRGVAGLRVVHYFISLFALARLHGLGEPAALLLQIAGGAVGVAGVVRAAQTRNPALLFVMVAAGTMLCTPYLYNYDTTPLWIASALLGARACALPVQDEDKPFLRLAHVCLAAGMFFVVFLMDNDYVPFASLAVAMVWWLGWRWMRTLPRRPLWGAARTEKGAA